MTYFTFTNITELSVNSKVNEPESNNLPFCVVYYDMGFVSINIQSEYIEFQHVGTISYKEGQQELVVFNYTLLQT